MKLEVQIFDSNGIHHAKDVIPKGWIPILDYTPHSCPWDYYGMRWGKERIFVMQEAGIDAAIAEDRMTAINPVGTGHKGAVRFGDNMIPHNYLLIVKKEDQDKAEQALAEHKKAVDDWLDGKANMPNACRG